MPFMDDDLLQYFTTGHLPEGPLRDVSYECADLAYKLAQFLPDGREKTAGLRKLLEAKDCFVRSALALLPDDSEAHA